MLTELCAELKNYFLSRKEQDIHYGQYTISGGSIEPLPFLRDGQYFRIVGSVLNDGVYQYPASWLHDEVFDGSIWAMSVPADVLNLSDEIKAWQAQNQDILSSPYQSESFGGYSYSIKSGTSDNGGSITWQGQFANRLNKWRRLSVL